MLRSIGRQSLSVISWWNQEADRTTQSLTVEFIIQHSLYLLVFGLKYCYIDSLWHSLPPMSEAFQSCFSFKLCVRVYSRQMCHCDESQQACAGALA